VVVFMLMLARVLQIWAHHAPMVGAAT